MPARSGPCVSQGRPELFGLSTPTNPPPKPLAPAACACSVTLRATTMEAPTCTSTSGTSVSAGGLLNTLQTCTWAANMHTGSDGTHRGHLAARHGSTQATRGLADLLNPTGAACPHHPASHSLPALLQPACPQHTPLPALLATPPCFLLFACALAACVSPTHASTCSLCSPACRLRGGPAPRAHDCGRRLWPHHGHHGVHPGGCTVGDLACTWVSPSWHHGCLSSWAAWHAPRLQWGYSAAHERP